jgi:diguanylate cyclase (GGDEF)-like protein/PAS domain S-box-containing protein
MNAISKPVRRAPIRVLLVEDVATDAELEVRELRRAGLRVEHRLVESEAAFLEALGGFAPEVIISDFSMPRFDGMAALALARETAPEVPFIFVSGTIGEEYAIRALKNGATDYVLKSNLLRLPAAVERALEAAADRLARRRAEQLSASEKEIYQLIASATPLAEVLGRLCRSVEEIAADGVLCSLLLLEEGARLRIGAAPSLPQGYNEAVDGIAIGPNTGSCGTAAFLGKAVIVADIATDPLWQDFRALAAEHGLRACWSVPILDADGKVLGTFANYYREPRAPAAPSLELIERACGLAQIAIARERAEASVREANQRLALALEGSGRALFDWNVATGTVYLSERWARIVGGERRPVQVRFDELLARVHPEDREAQRRRFAELLAGRSAACRAEYRVMTRSGAYRWIESHGKVVARGPDGAALRVSGTSADITDEMAQRKRIARLTRVRDMLGATNGAIVRLRERRALFEELCRIAVAQGGFSVARVIERGPDGRARIAATTESDASLYQRVLDEYNADPDGAHSLIAAVLRTGEPCVSSDAATAEPAASRAPLTLEGVSGVALLPISPEGRLAAVLGLRAPDPGAFDEEEMRLLREIVSNVAFALELMEKQASLDYLAYYDALTGLPNRMLFQDRLGQAIEAARREGTALGLLMFDLERFRAINEALGKHAGDAALRAVAGRLREAIGEVNRIGRLAGDVFAIAFPAIAEPADVARAMAEVGAKVLGAPLQLEEHEIRVSARCGIAVYPGDGANAEVLLQNAEAALLKAKHTGERLLFYAPQINARVTEQVDLEQRLRRAVDNGELFLHFQPKVALEGRRLAGVEALMRWVGPEGRPVPPARFIPLMEEIGLIYEAGKLALAKAAATHRAWRAAGLAAPRVAVNVSAVQLRQADFVPALVAALGNTGDCGVDLEVTESLMMEDVEASMAKLRQVRELGLGIALDDFGTGYSSLAYLARLPVDALKIDRAFIHGVSENANDTSLVSTIISLAQAMRLMVVAEGVETEDQARLLRLLRCDQMQGYLVSPPVPAEGIEAMLRGAPA